jgi:hypothetical protein
MTHDYVVHAPLLAVQRVSSVKRQLFHVKIAWGITTELCLVVSPDEPLVAIASNVRRPVVVDVNVPTAEQVGLLFSKMHVGDLTGHLLPVLERDVPDDTPRLKLVLIR